MTTAPTAVPMQLRPVMELESVLTQLLGEHRKLLEHVKAHHQAMQSLDLKSMDATKTLQQSSRTRILAHEAQRKSLMTQIARQNKLVGDPKLPQLAAIFPQRSQALMKLRNELNAVVTETSRRSFVAGKLAGAVLGHLNTAVRILARSVGDVGVYNNRGIPRIAKRMGQMEMTG